MRFKQESCQRRCRTNRKLYGDENPLGTPSFEDKVKLLETIDAYARAKDPRVRQVTASIAATWQVVEILRADGETYRDIRPLVRLNVSVVAGDFNDLKNSDATRKIIGRGKFQLADTRPAERPGDDPAGSPADFEPRSIAWTYFYGVDDTYSRIDYILLSPAMKRNWLAAETFIPKIANWGVGSDHRPIVAAFHTDAGR